MKATWNGVVIAESDNTEVVEGNHYFPPDAINASYFKPSSFRTTCPWKGEAHYYHVQVGDAVNENAAWFYPAPSTAAAAIKDHVAFWNGVEVA